jgi:transcriptional regulator with XRE-family HTH domain
MTQRELAIAVDLDYSYISKIENDLMEYTPIIKTILRIAGVLEVDELELLELADKVPFILEPIASDKNALRFFRRATEQSKTQMSRENLLSTWKSKRRSKSSRLKGGK